MYAHYTEYMDLHDLTTTAGMISLAQYNQLEHCVGSM